MWFRNKTGNCFLLLLLFLNPLAKAQTISSFLPKKINTQEHFLFYQHGAIVTLYGNNAVNDAAPEWGPYEYLNILDSLRVQGFNVIGEIRKPGITDSVYTAKIAQQTDSLLRAGVPPKNIVLVGASAGWSIVLHASAQLKNPQLGFVLMGGCWKNENEQWKGATLVGRFLSIIEKTDPHGSCNTIFRNRKSITSFKEIQLNTGLSHGFFYKGRKVWIEPLVKWAKGKK